MYIMIPTMIMSVMYMIIMCVYMCIWYVYIYMAYPGSKLLKKYSDYVRKDLSSYAEENTMDRFSMYNHSFDGGESWVEYDDKVVLIASGEESEGD